MTFPEKRSFDYYDYTYMSAERMLANLKFILDNEDYLFTFACEDCYRDTIMNHPENYLNCIKNFSKSYINTSLRKSYIFEDKSLTRSSNKLQDTYTYKKIKDIIIPKKYLPLSEDSDKCEFRINIVITGYKLQDDETANDIPIEFIDKWITSVYITSVNDTANNNFKRKLFVSNDESLAWSTDIRNQEYYGKLIKYLWYLCWKIKNILDLELKALDMQSQLQSKKQEYKPKFTGCDYKFSLNYKPSFNAERITLPKFEITEPTYLQIVYRNTDDEFYNVEDIVIQDKSTLRYISLRKEYTSLMISTNTGTLEAFPQPTRIIFNENTKLQNFIKILFYQEFPHPDSQEQLFLIVAINKNDILKFDVKFNLESEM